MPDTELTCTPPEEALTRAAAASMTSAGTSGRAGEQAATSASDMGSEPSEGVPPSAVEAVCAAARPAAWSRPDGLAAFVGVPSSLSSLSRFVGVVSAPLPCTVSLPDRV